MELITKSLRDYIFVLELEMIKQSWLDGSEKYIQGEYQDAIESLTICLSYSEKQGLHEEDPFNSEVYFLRGDCFAKLDQRQKAIDDYKQALRFNRKNKRVRRRLSKVLNTMKK